MINSIWIDTFIIGCPQEIVTGGKGGTITSPRFPLKYESRTYCEWKITASKPQNRILIQLETFKIEGEMGRDGGKLTCSFCGLFLNVMELR
jgi:hypothetical protein